MVEQLLMDPRFKPVIEGMIREYLQRTTPTRHSAPTESEYSWQEHLVLGKTDAAHDKGSSGTISIYGKPGDTIGSETDTTDNLTNVYNRFADVGSGKWVYVLPSISSGEYELVAAEC